MRTRDTHFVGAKYMTNVQWIPCDAMASSLTNATYSCDSQLVYASFVDGSVGVFDADSLRPRCRLASSVYLPAGISRQCLKQNYCQIQFQFIFVIRINLYTSLFA